MAYWNCKALRKEAEVQHLRLKEKVSYARAVNMAGQEKQAKVHGHNKGLMAMNVERDDKRKMWAGNKKLVNFILKATAEVKSKTERIQIIVKSAYT